MEVREILLLLDAGAANGGRLALAAEAARRCGARVDALPLCTAGPPPLADCYAIGRAAVCEVLDREAAEVQAALQKLKAAFGEAFAAPSPPAALLPPVLDEPPEVSALRCRTADLVVVGRAEERRGADAARAERLVFEGGAPCLLVPEGGGHFDLGRVVLAWNGSREAKRAMSDAMSLLQAAATVEVVSLGEPARAPPVSLEAVRRHLAGHGVEARVRHEPATGENPTEALRRRCRETSAGLLVMGAFSRSRAAERLLGGVTRSVLAEPFAPTLLSR